MKHTPRTVYRYTEFPRNYWSPASTSYLKAVRPPLLTSPVYCSYASPHFYCLFVVLARQYCFWGLLLHRWGCFSKTERSYLTQVLEKPPFVILSGLQVVFLKSPGLFVHYRLPREALQEIRRVPKITGEVIMTNQKVGVGFPFFLIGSRALQCTLPFANVSGKLQS